MEDIFRKSLKEAREMTGKARLASWSIGTSECCANCKNAKKSRDRFNKKCISCGLTNKIVHYNNHCSDFKKPFLGQTSDKRRDLILRDMLYVEY